MDVYLSSIQMKEISTYNFNNNVFYDLLRHICAYFAASLYSKLRKYVSLKAVFLLAVFAAECADIT